MTDQFVQTSEDNTDVTAQQEQQGGDQTPTGSEGAPDTKSPEYQLQVMQQRLQDKDAFIETLKSEGQTYREAVANMEERLQNMEKISEVLNKGQQQDVSNQDTGLDEDELVGKVIANLSQREKEQKMESNYTTVVSTLSDKFGSDRVNEKVKQAAEANGLTVEDMINTAKKSPQAFYKLVGVEASQQSFSQPTRSTVQAPSDNQEKDLAYYSRLMRENPREYFKPETQREFRKLFIKDKS